MIGPHMGSGLAVGAVALALAACGTQQPQAPVAQAGIVGNALTTIASSCGESYRLQQFTSHADLRRLDATAASSARKLAAIAARHPAWMYEGKTMTQLLGLSIQDLRGCGLDGAARVLRRQTA